MSKIGYIFALVVGLAMGLPDIVLAAEGAHGDMLNLTTHGWGYTSLIIFGVTSTMIQIKKGLDLPISGEPQQTVVETKKPSHVALVGSDYVGMKPSILVQVGDQVKKGQLLFIDKKNPGVHYTSPAAGWIVEINRGEKRAFQSMVIEVEGDEEIQFKAHDPGYLKKLDRDHVISQLLESGAWTSLRTRPFSKVAHPDEIPNSIFVTAIDTNPLAPSIEKVLDGRETHFANGLLVLSKLTDGNIFLCKTQETYIPTPDISSLRIEEFSGPHPAGLVGTHIHFLDPVHSGKQVWHINCQDVAMIGELFTTGRINVNRVISLGGPGVSDPKLVVTWLGACLDNVTDGELKGGNHRIISGSILSGHSGEPAKAYLGRYHQQISILPEGNKRELLGWLNMGFNKYSLKNITLAALTGGTKIDFDTSTNGSVRSIVPNVTTFDKIMPLDILPIFLFRALAINDLDEAEKLGILELDEEDLALCNFACPAKLDYGVMLRNNLNTLEKEG